MEENTTGIEWLRAACAGESYLQLQKKMLAQIFSRYRREDSNHNKADDEFSYSNFLSVCVLLFFAKLITGTALNVSLRYVVSYFI